MYTVNYGSNEKSFDSVESAVQFASDTFNISIGYISESLSKGMTEFKIGHDELGFDDLFSIQID